MFLSFGGKEHREWGEHFPESFLVLTNKACSSVECLFFRCNFYFQSLCSVSAQKLSPLQVRMENCLTRDCCSFLTFFTVINLENTNSKRKESKAIYIPSTQSQLFWLLFLSYIYYLLLTCKYENWEQGLYIAFSFDKTS